MFNGIYKQIKNGIHKAKYKTTSEDCATVLMEMIPKCFHTCVRAWKESNAPKGWMSTVVIPLSKGVKTECNYNWDITLLSIKGNMYGRAEIKVKIITSVEFRDEKEEFKERCGGIDL